MGTSYHLLGIASSTIAAMKNDVTYRVQPQGFGPWLKDQIQYAGYTQGEFAKRLGVSPTTVSRWVHGRAPEASFLDAISDILVIDYDVLATKAGYRPQELLEVDPDSPTAQLMPLIQEVNWNRYPDRLESLKMELRWMIERDRESKKG